MSLYGSNGQINTTSVSGSSYTGLQAADGSYNIVINNNTVLLGLHHPCGAYNAVVVTDPSAGYYAANGSMNVIANSNSPSGYSPVYPSPQATTLPTISGFYNFTGSNLPNWSTAQSAVNAGTRNAIMIPYGDSTTAGYGSVAGGQVDYVSQSYPTQLSALLTHGSTSSFSGNHNSPTNDFDARLSVGTWNVDSNSTLAGFAFSAASAVTLAFTPTNQIDTIEVWAYQASGLGSFTVHVDGGAALATINLNNATPAVFKTTINVSLGSHAIQCVWASGTAYVHTIRAYNSASKEISIMNAGASGWNSTQLSDSSIWLSPLTVLQDFTPDLTIIEGGLINDWCQSVAVATSQTNLQTQITAAKRSGSGDVILISPVPSQPGQVDSAPSNAVQQTYVDMMKALAYSNNIPMIDAWRLFGSTWQTSLMFNDVHPNGSGYSSVAGYCNTALASGFRAI